MKKIIDILKEMRLRHKEFRPEYVERQYANINRLFKLALCYSVTIPLVYVTIIKGDHINYALAEGISLYIISIVGHLCCIVHKKRSSNKQGNGNRNWFISEALIYILVLIFLLWGNVAISVSFRRDETTSAMVWIIINVLIAALITIMPYAVFVINGISLLVTILQISYFEPVGHGGIEIYNLVMFSFFITFVMIDKYVYEEYSFRNAKKVKDLQDDKERFLVNMTHELRTPLNAVLGKNEIIGNDTKEEETRRLSKEIASSGKVLLATINDILDLSKMESGKMNINPVEYSTENITYEVSDILKSEATAKGIGFKLEVSGNVPSVLFGDDIRIKQIILNLLSNAIKYTREGSVTLRVWFDYEDREAKRGILHAMVVDTGIGIKKEDIPNLNKAFSRVNEGETRTIQGTGLGLAITSSLLKLMDSELKVESIYEIGSTFSFDIWQGVVDETPLREKRKTEVTTQKKMFKAPEAKVLVVDDNYVNFSVCKGLMKYYDFEPEHAASGEACLKCISEKKYDIILLDHYMYGMDGFETLEQIKQRYPDTYRTTPVIALTANEGTNCEAEYLSHGFAGYLPKPIDSAKLHVILEKYLNK